MKTYVALATLNESQIVKGSTWHLDSLWSSELVITSTTSYTKYVITEDELKTYFIPVNNTTKVLYEY